MGEEIINVLENRSFHKRKLNMKKSSKKLMPEYKMIRLFGEVMLRNIKNHYDRFVLSHFSVISSEAQKL